ncbi:gastrula zinc finger protein XlCGF46.1-like [Agrilus planipennis]|uniref:Gastrula zinc finger protein XlCGF46.1-like n=1 Tax=Agrilus planipennis TaxID=224129 RepID=A0A1W4X5Z1_AGRPL|nr:gastrula zinc finger protein XlCGF46.1-like [Agrilus planipennis]XP_018328248.1 gastrula zinc finger protein XlCGF46.1-like [Agrilus planipennis]
MSQKISHKISANSSNCICRICFKEANILISVYDKIEKGFFQNIFVYNALREVLGKSIIELAGDICTFICSECLENLKIAYGFKLQCQESEKLLTEFWELSKLEIAKARPIQEDVDSASVEIISKSGRFDLKDLFVIEGNNNEEKSSFSGFLKNLGTEISAEFVHKNSRKKDINKFRDTYSVSIEKISNFKKNKIIKTDSYVSQIKDINQFACRKFKRTSSSQLVFEDHQKRYDRNTFLCHLCGHIAKTKSSYYNHNISKHMEKKFECKLCGKKYLYSSNLQVHINAIHLANKSYLCTRCGKRFSYSNALEYHMRLHTGEKKYVCTYCGKRFTMAGSLKRHIRTHTGVRPYSCRYCDKSFRSKGEVDCHEMTHTGYRPYTCKYCGKGFTKTHNLKVHIQCHPGPHICFICYKTFTETAYVKTHLKVVHGVKELPNENLLEDK